MKVAVWHDLHSGGAKRALFHHVEALTQAGHAVEIWTPSTADRAFAPLGELAREHVLPLDEQPGWSLAERTGLRPRSRRLIDAMADHARRCAAEIAAGGFDLLFANSSYRLAAGPIGRFTSLPSVLYLQEPWRFFYEAMPDLIWAAPPPADRAGVSALARHWRDRRDIWSARIQVREEALNVRSYDRVLCNSLFSRESILRAYGCDARVCYLGVDMSQFVATEQPRDDTIVGLGAFSPWKNPRLAVEAIAALPEPRPRLHWIANVADADYRAQVEQQARALGVPLAISVGISDTELRIALGRATAMIYTSRLEPFGLAPLEANACATPVVAIAEGGVRETVVDGVNGLLVDATPAALASALAKLRRDPALARQLGDRGRAMVAERWTHEAAGRRLVLQLEQAFTERHAGP